MAGHQATYKYPFGAAGVRPLEEFLNRVKALIPSGPASEGPAKSRGAVALSIALERYRHALLQGLSAAMGGQRPLHPRKARGFQPSQLSAGTAK